jgi:hypothetical protein
VAAGAVVILTAGGGSGQVHEPPPLEILRGPHQRVEANLQPIARRIATRVERLRGLEFERRPGVVVMGLRRLTAVGRGIARAQRRRDDSHPTRLRADRRLKRASTEFEQLAGLLPPESGLGPDIRSTGLERIGGAYDFTRERVVIVPALIETRVQLHYTLAHELTHALEDQHFRLRLRRLTAPSAAAEARRAVIEGTATFVQDLYRRRHLDDAVPLRSRIDAMRSVIAAGPGPYIVNAQAVFDYVDGGLFVYELYRRAGGFRLIDRALRHPPRRADQILHPRSWPGASRNPGVRLGVAAMLRSGWGRRRRAAGARDPPRGHDRQPGVHRRLRLVRRTVHRLAGGRSPGQLPGPVPGGRGGDRLPLAAHLRRRGVRPRGSRLHDARRLGREPRATGRLEAPKRLRGARHRDPCLGARVCPDGAACP